MGTGSLSLEQATFRPALPTDRDHVHSILYGEPGPEAVAIAGGSAQASALGRALAPRIPPPKNEAVFVCQVSNSLVGALHARVGGGDVAITPVFAVRMLSALLRTYRLREIVAVLRRQDLRRRVEFPPVERAYHIVQLTIAPDYRRRGLGLRLLEVAETHARELTAPRLSLTTRDNNPARFLFERAGYRERDRKVDSEYERLTGARGRILMVKELGR